MKYLTLAQLSAKLGNRSRASIYRDLDAGRLPQPIKLGGRLYWCDTQLDSFLIQLAKEAQLSHLSGR